MAFSHRAAPLHNSRIGPISKAASRIPAAATIAFGTFIVLTSVLGIVFGILAYNGWLAILYGLLGVTMGAAGIAGAWAKHPLREVLFGWCLLGLASRAVLVGDIFFLSVGIPIAAILIAALTYELLGRRSTAGTFSALGAGAVAVLSTIALAYAAPYLPALCPGSPAAGSSVFLIAYPPSVSPWDTAERKYVLRCLEARAR